MSVVALKYQGIQTIVSAPHIGLMVLTDMEEKRQISIVCDGYTRLQYAVRTRQINPRNIHFRLDEAEMENDDMEGSGDGNSFADEDTETPQEASPMQGRMLPEVLYSIINYMTDMRLGVSIVNIYDGEYRAVIIDHTSGATFPIKVTEGILLTLANRHVPLTIDSDVWRYQSVPYKKDGQGVALPINTLTMPMLKKALASAIDDERYEAAKALKEEIDRREGNNKM